MISFNETVLASRAAARVKRESVELLLEQEEIVQFDMAEVHTISSSYADELFGILYMKLGDLFFDRVTFSKATDLVVESIGSAIAIRQQSSPSKAA